jgi:hypothetical protein
MGRHVAVAVKVATVDLRRRVPRTDALLADPARVAMPGPIGGR